MNLVFELSKNLIKPKFTLILAVGLVIGVGFLLIILSLFQNYYLASEKVFMGIHPHIQVYQEEMTETAATGLAEELAATNTEITAAAPALYLTSRGTVSHADRIKAHCVQVGTELEPYDSERHTDVKLHVRYGYEVLTQLEKTFQMKGITVHQGQTISNVKDIINGSTDLEELNLTQDERGRDIPLSFYLQQGLIPQAVFLEDFLISLAGLPNPQPMMLRGSLNLGTKQEKYPLLVTSLANLQRLSGKQGRANTIEIAIKEPRSAAEVGRRLQARLGSAYKVTSWIEKEQGSFVFLGTIKMMIFAVVFSICIVAASSIVSTLTVTVMQNRRKIAILKALGLNARSIYAIFLTNTGLIGSLGIVLGGGLGVVGGRYFVHAFGESLKSLGIHDPRLQVAPADFLLIAVTTLALCFLAAVVPAREAINLQTVAGLRD